MRRLPPGALLATTVAGGAPGGGAYAAVYRPGGTSRWTSAGGRAASWRGVDRLDAGQRERVLAVLERRGGPGASDDTPIGLSTGFYGGR